jgi:hypothetical protein
LVIINLILIINTFFKYSPPRDIKKSQPEGSMLVLDIAGPAPLPTQCVQLMLRKPDKRRISTQHWELTNDGRMKCRVYENLYVQAKDGFGTGNTSSSNAELGAWQLCNAQFIQLKMKRDKKFLF